MSNTTQLRRYNIAEIDAMRKHLYAIEFAGQRYSLEPGICYWPSDSFQDEEKFRSQRVEDRLRTYMIGGVSPEEIATKAEEAKAEQTAWYEQERKRLEEKALQAEYGPRQ